MAFTLVLVLLVVLVVMMVVLVVLLLELLCFRNGTLRLSGAHCDQSRYSAVYDVMSCDVM